MHRPTALAHNAFAFIVCLSVCAVPDTKSWMEGCSKLKIDTKEVHDKDDPWPYLEVERSKVKVSTPINAVTEKFRIFRDGEWQTSNLVQGWNTMTCITDSWANKTVFRSRWNWPCQTNIQAVNSRQLDRQKRRHENRTNCDKHTVHLERHQIADDSDRQRRRPGCSNQRRMIQELVDSFRWHFLPDRSRKTRLTFMNYQGHLSVPKHTLI